MGRDEIINGLLGMKMKLRIATAVSIYVLFEVVSVKSSSCSSVFESPCSSERQKRVYHSVVLKKGKCPFGMIQCICIERYNRKLDITCSNLHTNDLKVSDFNQTQYLLCTEII